MSYPSDMRVFCFACRELLAEEGEPVPEDPCPKCGVAITAASRRGQEFKVSLGGIRITAYPPGRRGDHWFHRSDAKHSHFAKNGRDHFYERVYDRDSDRYDERIVDVETGQVVREVHEPLSDHQGHGSAKKK